MLPTLCNNTSSWTILQVFWCIMAVLLMHCFCTSHGQVRRDISDPCDWQGSGLDQEDEFEDPGVTSIYLRCTRGRIQWKYPRGALRIILRAEKSGKEFRGCFRVSRHFQGARIHLESHRKLVALYSPTDGKPKDLLRCFNSENGQAVLYVEAEPLRNKFMRHIAEFHYDIQLSNQGKMIHDSEECQPCTPAQLLQVFCTSDFAVIGTINALAEESSLGRTEITVRATEVIRDTSVGGKLFPTPSASKHLETVHSDSSELAVLYRPSKCNTKAGSGQFLFMGRWVLGTPMVRCAPRLSQWKHVRTKALLTNSATCKLV